MHQTGKTRFKWLVASLLVGVAVIGGFGMYGFAQEDGNEVRPTASNSAENLEWDRKRQLAELEAAEVSRRNHFAAQEAAELKRKLANAEAERLERLALDAKNQNK